MLGNDNSVYMDNAASIIDTIDIVEKAIVFISRGRSTRLNIRVAVLVGSLRKDSYNRRLALAIERVAGDRLVFTHAELGGLPLYNQDDDQAMAPAALRLKAEIDAAQGVLLVTPEYNRGMTGVLKNAIDIASRPYGKNSFTRKPSAVIGTSPGKIGTAVGQQHLRSILAFCNSPQTNAVEAYIQFEPGLITDEGEVTNDETAEFLRNYMTEFHAFIVRVYTVLPRNA